MRCERKGEVPSPCTSNYNKDFTLLLKILTKRIEPTIVTLTFPIRSMISSGMFA